MENPTIRVLAAGVLTVGLALAGLAGTASAGSGPACEDAARTLVAQADAGGAAPEAPAAPAAPPATSEATKALWTKNCASCHGESGKADTKTGTMLKVRDLTDPAVRAAFDRDRMIKATKEGVKKEGSDKLVMKGFADKLSDAEIAALIDHVYALGQ